MRRLSIGLGLRLALIGLTAALIAIAGLGVASLYGARADYEDRLLATYELEASAARLLAAGLVEETAFAARGRGAGDNRRRAVEAFMAEAETALGLAREDPESLRLVERRIDAQERLRSAANREGGGRGGGASAERREAITREARELTDALGARQSERRDEANDAVAGETRRATVTIAVAALLAVLAALLLVRDLTGRLRRPLDELVRATRRLAGGDLSERVGSDGPREVQELGDSFNAMADDLRRAHDRIEDERLKLATTIESLGDGLVVCNEHGQVVACNPRAESLMPDLRVGHPIDSGDRPLPPLGAALEHEVMLEREGRTIAVTAAPLDTGPGGSVWTLRDISERARLERMKTDFVSAASHELRSPLTSIKGFVELLSRSERLDPRQRESVEVIRLSTDRLVDLVDDLLEVARIEAGKLSVELRPVELSGCVSHAAKLMEPRLAEKRQQLELACEPDVPTAHADPARLQEIVENLVTNAHLYTPERGRITVRCAGDGDAVTMEVSDTGRGMTAEELEHAFDRFYRGHEESELTPGTGLGLWIVKSLVELQDGTISVASTPGKGSTFTVRLPRAPSDDPDPAVSNRLRTASG